MSYPNSPLSPYSAALVLQFTPGPFYKFVALYLIFLYQLESLHLDDYNLTYSQNKNRGFDKFLKATPLKTQHFPFYKHSLKPIQTNTNQQYTSKLNPTQPQNLSTTNQNHLYIRLGFFPKSKHKKKMLGFSFSYL